MDAYLLLAIGLALIFEFVNGFHDTANAVATLIYTNTLRPGQAVAFSGTLNFVGAILSRGGVAYSIVHLFPPLILLHFDQSREGHALIFGILSSALFWNLGTWYFGLPASSSHTLIGAMLGGLLGYSAVIPGMNLGDGVQWTALHPIILALLISPLLGFCLAAALLLMLRQLPGRKLHLTAEGKHRPPLWIRVVLLVTSGGVSLAHGSNDGQKGMGLLMLILLAFAPSLYALNPAFQQSSQLRHNLQVASRVMTSEESYPLEPGRALQLCLEPDLDPGYLRQALGSVAAAGVTYLDQKSPSVADRLAFRQLCRSYLEGWRQLQQHPSQTPSEPECQRAAEGCREVSEYVSPWVQWAMAVAIGIGTMVGWRRVVVTVGEHIGKQHLTYAQAASAEAATVGAMVLAEAVHLPVSTTHILSSGVAGTMVTDRSGLHQSTVVAILTAWVLTLPVTMLMAAWSYWILRQFI